MKSGLLTRAASARDVELAGDYAYVANHKNGFYVIDISDPVHAHEVGAFGANVDPQYPPPGGIFMSVATAGPYVYLAERYYGVRVLDFSDPTNLQEISVVTTDRATLE